RADMDRQYVLPFGTPADVTALVKQLYNAFGTKNGGYIGYGQINTDVPIANAEAMLTVFSRLTYPAAGKAPAR
ncbi:MAG: hypothetical protein NTW68_15770, partial [candidate division NC10 bacterium]|nr:hypothetical protein [candidate division NC10 bacterium]